jgi:hypothetical protein
MLARTLILGAVGFVIAAATRVLIRTRRKREDKLRREGFKHVCKLAVIRKIDMLPRLTATVAGFVQLARLVLREIQR